MEQTGCPCYVVRYARAEQPDGSVIGRWECTRCGAAFDRVERVIAQQVATLVEEHDGEGVAAKSQRDPA